MANGRGVPLMFAGIPFSAVDGCFFRCKVHLLNYFCLDFFLYLRTVHMICMFQSSKGFKRRALICCLQEVEIHVHTFVYV